MRTTERDQNKRPTTQFPLAHGLSVILPAHNEEQVIAETVSNVCETLAGWTQDFEVIVVNDGSVDQTGAILAGLAQLEPHLRIVTHPVNQGYGAALVSGFEAVSSASITCRVRAVRPPGQISKSFSALSANCSSTLASGTAKSRQYNRYTSLK